MDDLLINKIFENINRNDIYPGCIIASISKQMPNYYFHWTRDAALVMRVIIKHYKKREDLRCFKQMINYINVESKFQNLETQGGLGEPKYNVNITSFNDTWGRPQNDGPALRGLVMLEIYKIMSEYPFIQQTILNIMRKDLKYILCYINSPCFDLWEEEMGYHLYTRGVQLKFLKEILVSGLFSEMKSEIESNKKFLENLIIHHQNSLTSFNLEGKKCREFDTCLLLLVSHIDYDLEIFDIRNSQFLDYIKRMRDYFRNQYKINHNSKILLLGRYQNDKYFGGNPWIICSAAYYQLLIKLKQLNINDLQEEINYISFRKFLEEEKLKKLNLPEQIDKNDGSFISAGNLTWNYAEIYIFYEMLYDNIYIL